MDALSEALTSPTRQPLQPEAIGHQRRRHHSRTDLFSNYTRV
jgi:hypothetical protein